MQFANSPKTGSVTLRGTLVEKGVQGIDALLQKQQKPVPSIVLQTVSLSTAPLVAPFGLYAFAHQMANG